MHPNPLLKQLGFASHDRVVIFHADDIGMCHATLPAYAGLVDFGLLSSASVMVPCPWFPKLAAFCRNNRSPNIDMGVHLTLTSEWGSYRWGPISTRDPASGLLDAEGYFYRTTEEAQAHGNPAFVRQEIRTQVQRALDAGIDITHIDSHMGSIFHPQYINDYVELSRDFQVPVLLIRRDEAGFRDMGIDPDRARFYARLMADMENQGLPMLDHLMALPLDNPAFSLDQAQRMVDEIPAGITYFILHPAIDTPELRAMTRSWESRVANYRLLMNESFRTYITRAGIHVIGWRVVRDFIRSKASGKSDA